MYNSVTSTAALADPFNNDMTFDKDFIASATSPTGSAEAFLQNTLVDTHFVTRDRMGRMVAFLARVNTDGWSPNRQPMGIGINEETALLISPGGMAQVFGNAKAKSLPQVSLIQTPRKGTLLCSPNVPLTYAPLLEDTILAGGTFNLSDWGQYWKTTSTITVSNGVLTNEPARAALASIALSESKDTGFASVSPVVITSTINATPSNMNGLELVHALKKQSLPGNSISIQGKFLAHRVISRSSGLFSLRRV